MIQMVVRESLVHRNCDMEMIILYLENFVDELGDNYIQWAKALEENGLRMNIDKVRGMELLEGNKFCC